MSDFCESCATYREALAPFALAWALALQRSADFANKTVYEELANHDAPVRDECVTWTALRNAAEALRVKRGTEQGK